MTKQSSLQIFEHFTRKGNGLYLAAKGRGIIYAHGRGGVKSFCEYKNTCYICGNKGKPNSLMCKFKDNNLGIKKLVEAISKIFSVKDLLKV